eukprot:4697182-Pyramimonas_sp.AAC.1
MPPWPSLRGFPLSALQGVGSPPLDECLLRRPRLLRPYRPSLLQSSTVLLAISSRDRIMISPPGAPAMIQHASSAC